MRRSRSEVFFFNLTLHHIDELFIKLPFKHQQIHDAIFLSEETIVMTRQDISIYPKDQPTHDHPKRVYNSARKGEVFKRVFFQEGQQLHEMLLILTIKDQICVRTFK